MAPSLEENEYVGEWHIAAPLDASKLQVTLVNNPKPLPMGDAIVFGKTVTDHMLRVTWTAESGWDIPRIAPYGPIVLDPVASGLHYGFECFEGMKAYRDAAGRLRLFRPELNAARLNRSAARISLPTFDEAEFVKLVRMFVKIEGRWVGNGPPHSLYIRPVLVSTTASLGVSAPTSALLYVVASPATSYFSASSTALSLYAMPPSRFVRACPGGPGASKIGGNYAPTLAAESEARKAGCAQVLWLSERKNSGSCAAAQEDELRGGEVEEGPWVGEAGTMNFFAVFGRRRQQQQQQHGGSEVLDVEVVTPPLDGTILPGVIRQSALELLRQRRPAAVGAAAGAGCGSFTVCERPVSLPELQRAAARGQLLEAFGTGTAACVVPIGRVLWEGRWIDCKGWGSKSGIAEEVKGWLEGRMYGGEESKWSVVV